MSDHESDDEPEEPYVFVRAHTTRASTSSNNKLRESFSDLMKRRLPRVFSSFRSSKRKQVASVQNGEGYTFIQCGQGKFCNYV